MLKIKRINTFKLGGDEFKLKIFKAIHYSRKESLAGGVNNVDLKLFPCHGSGDVYKFDVEKASFANQRSIGHISQGSNHLMAVQVIGRIQNLARGAAGNIIDKFHSASDSGTLNASEFGVDILRSRYHGENSSSPVVDVGNELFR